jgi:hypothetical protein
MNHPGTATHLEEKNRTLIQTRTKLLADLAQAAERRQPARIRRLCQRIVQVNDFLESLEKIKAETKPLSNGPARHYIVSSLFLHQCFKDLTADQDEQLFFVTGSEVDGVRVLDQKIEFLHQKRGPLGVVGNMSSTHRLLIRLEQFGHRLLAHFHSHPGKGAGATHPSGTDENYQRRLEAAGYPTVAAIFSRDGYIRFFRLDDNLQMEIHGDGVENLGKHTYRLKNLDQA